MGLNLALIITKNIDIDVPIEVTHFKDKNLLILPIENLEEFGWLTEMVIESGNNVIWDYESELEFISLIRNLNITSFVASCNYNSSYWEFAVIDGRIIMDHIINSEIEDLSININNPFKPMGISGVDSYKYYNFYNARYRYEEEKGILGKDDSYFRNRPSK